MALKKIQGKIAKAGAYPLKAPKTVKFGNEEKTFTHRHTIQMETGEWIGFGESDLADFVVKDDNDKWAVLGTGSEVLIKYEENGDFKNAKKANLVVLDLVVGEKFEGSQQSSNNAPSNNSKGDNVNPAEVGQCLNLAVEVLGLDGKQLLDDTEVTKAIAWYKAVREKFNSLYSGVESTGTPEKKPAKKEPVVEDEYDDECV